MEKSLTVSCWVESTLRVLCSQPPKATHVKMGGTGWLPSFLAQENQCLQQCGMLGTQQV